MTLLLDQDAATRDPRLVRQSLRRIGADAAFLRSSYPHFDHWFKSKVVLGIYTGERTLLIEERESTVVGLLILKHTATEKKLCTLRVRPEFESRGLGVRLFEAAFERLGTERPLLSVSESTLPKFARLFDHFGFLQSAAYRGLYLPHVHELSYNGLLGGRGEVLAPDQRGCQFPRARMAIAEKHFQSTVARHGGQLDYVGAASAPLP